MAQEDLQDKEAGKVLGQKREVQAWIKSVLGAPGTGVGQAKGRLECQLRGETHLLHVKLCPLKRCRTGLGPGCVASNAQEATLKRLGDH